MKVGVCIEVSTKPREADVVAAMQRAGLEVCNFGMRTDVQTPELTYLHTGFLSALFLNLGIVDMVVGGCGTGQGYLNSVLQYPGVSAGLILDPVDAFLFSQINAGNVIVLALNKGYGTFGADINLDYIFEKLFAMQSGTGYPPHRAQSQQQSRKRLVDISKCTHRKMHEIIQSLNQTFVKECLCFPGVLTEVQHAPESELKQWIITYAKGCAKMQWR